MKAQLVADVQHLILQENVQNVEVDTIYRMVDVSKLTHNVPILTTILCNAWVVIADTHY